MSFDSTVLFEEMDLWNEYFYFRWPKIIVLGPDHTTCTKIDANKSAKYWGLLCLCFFNRGRSMVAYFTINSRMIVI